ncbi:hypothetical protein LUZ60_015254 [Juncus effusus]|nr:hypothetical protein LUZ60_015254 [Juncus effusus]
MNLRIESSKHIKPLYADISSNKVQCIPLSVFDKVSEDINIAAIFAFRPPTPPNSMVEIGLARALVEYREWAGRLGKDPNGNHIILLNDKGARFIEANADSTTLDEAMSFNLFHATQTLHPRKNGVDELLQVQLTRFACGSLVIGYTMSHRVADGIAASQFLITWGLASRGAYITGIRNNIHDRALLFKSTDQPRIEFNHRGVEFSFEGPMICMDYTSKGNIVVHKVHFSNDFLKRIKSRASSGSSQRFTTFESLIAHLWRVITMARRLDGDEITNIRISINGRSRVDMHVPENYFGNVILWAYPHARVRDLLSRPLKYAAELIHNEVKKVNNRYFRSFIDFANSKAVEEQLIPVPEPRGRDMLKNVDVDSWLRFPLNELDFGGGRPFYFMPSFLPVEGWILLLPSFLGDGSVEAHVPLFERNLGRFKRACYSLDSDLYYYGYTNGWNQEEGKLKELARL